MQAKMTPETPGGWAGWALSAVIALFAAYTHFKRAKIDDRAGALGMWEGLAKAHTAEIASLTARLSKAEEAIAQMRIDHATQIAELTKKHAADIASRDDQIAGLVRMIAQNSQSNAQMLGDVANGNHHGMEVAKAVGKALSRKGGE